MVLPPIANWSAENARQAVRESLGQDFEINRLMLEDKDFWQGGSMWPGHRTGDKGVDDALLRNIEPQFSVDDILSEVMENFADGLLHFEASVMLDPMKPAPKGTPAEETQQQDQTAKLRSLSLWWDRKKFWRKARAAAKRSRYAPLKDNPGVGRGDLRFWVPPVNLTTTAGADGSVTRLLPTLLPLDDALARVEVDDVRPDVAAIYIDPLTRERAAVLLVMVGEQEEVEVWTVRGQGDTRETVLRVLTSGNVAAQAVPEFVLKLGGRLPLVELEGDILLTKPTRQIQNILNFITTVLPRTVETAGFKERYFLNAEPPGIWLRTPPEGPALDKKEEGGVTWYKHRVPWVLGASITTEVQGIWTAGADKVQQFANPGVTIAEPTDPKFVTDAATAVEGLIYKRCRQGHLAITSIAEASGVAYQQHRAQFENDLGNAKAGVEGLVRDGLETALAFAALMSEEAVALLRDYRIVVDLHIHAGPVTPDEARLATELRDKRAIGQQTMMSRVGVEDTVAEEAAIVADPFFQLDLSKKRAEIVQAWIAAGAEMGVAASFAGLTPEETQMLVTASVPQPETQLAPTIKAA